jgi:hypothetical protein
MMSGHAQVFMCNMWAGGTAAAVKVELQHWLGGACAVSKGCFNYAKLPLTAGL